MILAVETKDGGLQVLNVPELINNGTRVK